ncbi:MAG TPA: YkgJ family cysteine cluster protein [Myxococcota bacterium]|nr:YkgJ family cysteine cluster protein [Myxococcota bacterium]
MLSGPNHVFSFVCQQTGRCCRAGWKVEIDHYDQVNLVAKARGTELEAAIAERVVPDASDGEASEQAFERTYHLEKDACGACSFLDGDRCGIHGALGPQALPDPCRNFPVIAMKTAWGTEVGYNLACPHAIALTAASPFSYERREEWERPLDPQQTKATFIAPDGGWNPFLASRRAAIAKLSASTAETLLADIAEAMSLLGSGSWTAADIERWCDALALEPRVAVVIDECAPFLKTWGPALGAAPSWSSLEDGLGLDPALAARYLQHTLHTVYFRTGQPMGRAYLLALAAFAMAVRMAPALSATYSKAPLRAAIVLTEVGLFGDLRSLGVVELPPGPPEAVTA